MIALLVMGVVAVGLVISGVVIFALRELPGYLDRREWRRYVADIKRELRKAAS